MKKMTKLKLQNAEILKNEDMRNIKGKGDGLCVFHCSNGSIITVPYKSCTDWPEFCSGGGMCNC